jgi:hypothetical protein
MIRTDHYEISYDNRKNRFYFKIIGYWSDPSQVPDYLDHWNQMASKARPGVTILADVREMKVPGESVQPLHQQAQAHVLEAGLAKVAEVTGSAVTKLSLDRISGASGMKAVKRSFTTVEEAEAWLDES